ncbi:hypothetical protein COCMIDRAFT_85359 [Bipolaris oryzae ATCC 44560]|uniref:DUF3176 domain containing protein n=1 Tax=Bipolaris oryzae ATCC 44560 TaxID=930090 RepID=W6ZGG4_COCMI|nr:uncharacterized protein COCMIDRAFT_85359 [Bipolaris oryzae ATCC 44560]EUC49125.1 hypothetical protein COCMIDRAFT_85359 [Bipolaris oryzae ATCC 44560]
MARVQENILPFTSDESQFPYMPTGESAPRPPPKTYQATRDEKRRFDFPGRLEQKLAQYNASESTWKRWLFEIISVTISAACMGAIIGLLYRVNNKSLNTWAPALTVITVLSKVASAALILPISEAIGQLKWTWFHGKKSRDAFDFEIFDKASRGAWGSVMLLCRTRGRSLAALGALLTILLLAIDTFFQQVTNLPERWKLEGESFIPSIVRYEPTVQNQYEASIGVPMAVTNNELRRGMVPFFYDQNGTRPLITGNATQAEIPLLCPTGRCEWPPYDTLAVCSACEDISHLLEYGCLMTRMDWIREALGRDLNYTAPKGAACGYFINATSDEPVLMSGFRVSNFTDPVPGETLLMRSLPLVTTLFREPLYGSATINFEHIQYRLLDALIVSSADGTAESVYKKERPVAQECMLTWCVKTLRSSYHDGDYKEEVQEVFINNTKADFPWSIEHIPNSEVTEQSFYPNISIRPPSLPEFMPAFGVSNETFFDITFILDEIFPSMITMANPTAQPFIKIFASHTDKAKWRSFLFSPWLAPNNVAAHLERMAHSITNVIRSDTDSSELIPGSAYARETYVAVQWGWLAFPLAMLILSIVFLVSTIRKTSSDSYEDLGTWKTSAMPALMYSLPKDIQEGVVSTTRPRVMRGKRASKVRIRLLPKQGWRVSGQIIARPPPPPGFF